MRALVAFPAVFGNPARLCYSPLAPINPRRPEDTFLAWLGGGRRKLVVLVDEIDTLIGAPFCDQFFSKLRSR